MGNKQTVLLSELGISLKSFIYKFFHYVPFDLIYSEYILQM